jgi:hypothetical protein
VQAEPLEDILRKLKNGMQCYTMVQGSPGNVMLFHEKKQFRRQQLGSY